MHQQAYEWVDRHADADAARVLDIGGRNINGTIRDRFPGATEYVVLDIVEDAGVDIVADAATWRPDERFDAVVCAEVFEHTPVWREICLTVAVVLEPGGQFIATMAGPGRAPHSAMDGGPELRPGEHYGNIDPDELEDELVALGFEDVTVDQLGEDVRCVAFAPAVDRG
ncbi:methyltransferase domain-containing protein [Amycolatopsis sp. NPDC051128]|uniref:class I SAM-dependent methyltransferase n=1 Tax=Amycolatopsis sp. NPDC051128 TaxID=3155412 RepID=UPI00342A96DD